MSQVTKHQEAYGVVYKDSKGSIHREDGPAVEYNDGKKAWFFNGLLHRTDGPAYICDNNHKFYIAGVLHRTNGPAIEYYDGSKVYVLLDKEYSKEEFDKLAPDMPVTGSVEKVGSVTCSIFLDKEGARHNPIGPAYTDSSGSKSWWIHGKRHRLDGPAIIDSDGSKHYFISGIKYTEESFKEKIKKMTSADYKILTNDKGQLHCDNGPAVINANGKEWHVNGMRHRLDGPAVEQTNGNKVWYIDNIVHRNGGPAIENSNGTKEWFANNQRHRIDGPAIEYANGEKAYYLLGKSYVKEEFDRKVADMPKEVRCLILAGSHACFEYFDSTGDRHNPTGPAYVRKDVSSWWIHGKRHRTDGPALIEPQKKEWWNNNQLHRLDGPAIEHTNGNKEYYIDGIKYDEKMWEDKVKTMSIVTTVGNDKRWTNPCSGKLHRTDGPAVIRHNGDEEYHVNGLLHRVDGPAMNFVNGQQQYYRYGHRHRVGGPAVISNIATEYWVDGQRHRSDGPAFERGNEKIYFIFGVEYSKARYEELAPELPVKHLVQDKVISHFDARGMYHNPHRAAIVERNEVGTVIREEYYSHGMRHRSSGPAIIRNNGSHQEWWSDNKLHNINGPAVIKDGTEAYYLNGIELSKDDWLIKSKEASIKSVSNNIAYYKDNANRYHRIGGPSVENLTNGYKEYHVHGKLHREDGPALEYTDGGKEYWLNDKKHRTNGPAVEFANGYKEYWVDGKLHRANGPAVEHVDGRKEYYANNVRHRTDGPAIVQQSGSSLYYINGYSMSKEEYENYSFLQPNAPVGESIYVDWKGHRHNTKGPAYIHTNGNKSWWIHGKLHRVDGPAVERSNGVKEYYLNGNLHRENGPAIERDNGAKEYWLNGLRHRLDGPAIEHINKANSLYYIDGKHLTKEEFDKAVDVMSFQFKFNDCEDWKDVNGKDHRIDGPAKIHPNASYWCNHGNLHRVDGPAVEYTNGDKQWWINGKLHREDGPAIIDCYGKRWIQNGILHREDGPAVESFNGGKEWWINGKRHRIDGPSIENFNGDKYYHIDDMGITEKEFKKQTKPSLTSMIKSDAELAAYQIAATQLTNASKAAFLFILSDKLDKTKLEVLKEVLESPIGNALISTMLGHGLEMTSQAKNDARVSKLASEFRVHGMTIVGNEFVDVIKNTASLTLSNMSKTKQMNRLRIANSQNELLEEEELESNNSYLKC